MNKISKSGNVITVTINHQPLNVGLQSIRDDEKSSYSNFSKFISSYVRFIFEAQGSFYLRSKHLSNEIDQHQKTYLFGSHYFNENAKNILTVLEKLLTGLNFDERKQIIYLFIHRLSEILSKKNSMNTILENFESISALSVFMRDFWTHIIEPNKRCVENPWGNLQKLK